MCPSVSSRCFRNRRSGSAGFTVLELLLAITVASILLGIGVPSYQRFVATQRVKTAVSDLNYTLLYARSEAIKRNAEVVVAPAGDCWQDGWAVTVGSTTLATQTAYPDLSIAAASTPAGSVRYNGEGRVDGSATPFEFSSLASAEVEARCVSLDLSGLPGARLAACRTPVEACS